VSAAGFGGRGRRPAGDMYDFFSIDFDYGDGVHIHSMCRQIKGCWNWGGHDFAYEKGHTNGGNGPWPKKSAMPADLPLFGKGARKGSYGHQQEHINLLYHLTKGKPFNQTKAVAEATAAAVLGRTSAYTGQLILWSEMMEDPAKNPKLYNLTLKPTAEDFEKGTVAIPKEGAIPLPGVKA
jgi:hypothetical protein